MDAIFVKKKFDDYFRSITKGKLEQQQFLLNHPRRKIAEENVLKEIKVASLRMGNRFQKKQLDMLIIAGAQIFGQLAINAKIKELMTAAELRRHEQKAGELADTQAMVDDMTREAMSTAITKAVPGLRDGAGQAGQENGDQLGGSGSDGDTLQSPGRDPAGSDPL